MKIANAFSSEETIVISPKDSFKTLKTCPDGFAKLIITSPPYNIGKVYEKKSKLDKYLSEIKPMLHELYRVLSIDGSICWQVGNYIKDGEVFPLDIFYYQLLKDEGFQLRNRIVWYFDHGLHIDKRFD